MKKTINVLQAGPENWEMRYRIPSEINWVYTRDPCLAEGTEGLLFEAVILDGGLCEDAAERLPKLCAAYTCFCTDRLTAGDKVRRALENKRAKTLPEEEIQPFLDGIPARFFENKTGTKLKAGDIEINESLGAQVSLNGNKWVEIEGEFGGRFVYGFSFRYNVILHKGETMELWPEYRTEGELELVLRVMEYRGGRAAELIGSRDYTEDELREPIRIHDAGGDGYFAFSVWLRGKGRLCFAALHYRYSRLGLGQFIPGGKRWADQNREEFLSYLNPGDGKPPLNVYFSGYRTAEGFEGYYMMESFGAPYLLFADPRLEGGCFYLGSAEYEAKIGETIRGALAELGFTREQLILTGVSMGSFGAMYYGCSLKPHAIVLGKPLMNLGDIAANERLLRPGGFPTSLDILRTVTGGSGEAEIRALNGRIWDRIAAAELDGTTVAAAYMEQDDYDPAGYEDLLRVLSGKGVQIFGKGLEGRHNDDTAGIMNWFRGQLRRILREDFQREV